MTAPVQQCQPEAAPVRQFKGEFYEAIIKAHAAGVVEGEANQKRKMVELLGLAA